MVKQSTRLDRVLAAVSDREVFDPLRKLLGRASIDCDRVANGEACLILSATAPYDLIVVQLPLIDMSASMFMTALRDSGSPSQKTSVIMHATGSQAAAVTAFQGAQRGMVEVSSSLDELLVRVSRALGLSVRSPQRLLINVHVAAGDEGSTRVYQTENLSGSGMLLKTHHPLPVGTQFLFDFDLPKGDAAFQGTGEVVRHTNPKREFVYGMGIRFTGFQAGSENQLDSFVRHSVVGPL